MPKGMPKNGKRKVQVKADKNYILNLSTYDYAQAIVDYSRLSQHLSNEILLKYKTKEAFIQAAGISPIVLKKFLDGDFFSSQFGQIIRICDLLDLNPFDMMPDKDYEINRFKYNKIMTMFCALNNYGRRRIVEQIADYLKLEKYTRRSTSTNYRQVPEIDRNAVEYEVESELALRKQELNPDVIEEYDKMSKVSRQDIKEDFQNELVDKVHNPSPTIQPNVEHYYPSRQRKVVEENRQKRLEEADEFAEYLREIRAEDQRANAIRQSNEKQSKKRRKAREEYLARVLAGGPK